MEDVFSRLYRWRHGGLRAWGGHDLLNTSWLVSTSGRTRLRLTAPDPFKASLGLIILSRSFSGCGRKPWFFSTCAGDLRELNMGATRENHVVPTSWQDEALARDGVSREVPCSALKGETVLDSLPATPKSSSTRRVPSQFLGISCSGSGSQVLHKGTDSVGPGFCALPRSEQLSRSEQLR